MSRRFGWMQPTESASGRHGLDLAGLLGLCPLARKCLKKFCRYEKLQEISLSDAEMHAFASTMEDVLKQEVREG